MPCAWIVGNFITASRTTTGCDRVTLYYSDDLVTLYHGDCIEVIRGLPDASVHAVVTDPPYGLEFMGKGWDKFTSATGRGVAGVPFQEWCEVWATEALRVLKPGGYMLAFGGSRTWHRLAVAVEDAGFEIRDSIAWLYGAGFPKSLDVSKAIDAGAGHVRGQRGELIGQSNSMTGLLYERMPKGDPVTAAAAGWGTALKPAHEPVVVGRKPLAGTVAANFMAYGTGALNIAATRVTLADGRGREQQQQQGQYNAASGSTPIISGDNRDKVYPVDLGRWPPNVAMDESQAEALDAQTGVLTSGLMKARTNRESRKGGVIYGADQRNIVAGDTYVDEGGASRFFPTFHYEAKAPGIERPDVDGTQHPTVKPLTLMRWLVRLVASPGAVILDPFAGSGTTLEACLIEGFEVIGIEREDLYLPLIMQRIRKPLQQTLFGGLP